MLLSHWLIDNITIGVSAIMGVATMLIAAATTRHFSGINEVPVKQIAKASHRGAALTLMTGTAYGLRSPIMVC
jgi:Na+/H+-translocating membrane pyrophosphatase